MTAKWERREAKRETARRRMPKHGRTLAAIYANAVLKRARNGKHKKKR
jgi:hypothetical protein